MSAYPYSLFHALSQVYPGITREPVDRGEGVQGLGAGTSLIMTPERDDSGPYFTWELLVHETTRAEGSCRNNTDVLTSLDMITSVLGGPTLIYHVVRGMGEYNDYSETYLASYSVLRQAVLHRDRAIARAREHNALADEGRFQGTPGDHFMGSLDPLLEYPDSPGVTYELDVTVLREEAPGV